MKKRMLYTLLSLMLMVALPISAQTKMDIRGGLSALPSGTGSVTLYWFPPQAVWPDGGFQIQDQEGKVLVKQLLPFQGLDELEGLSQTDLAWLKKLSEHPAALSNRSAAQNTLRLSLVLKSALSPEISKGLGLIHTLTDLPKGKRSYRVLGLDKQGRPTGLVLKCPAVDAFTATRLPDPPTRLKALSTPRGVALYWQKKPVKENDIIHFEVERKSRSGEFVNLLAEPLLAMTGETEDQNSPRYIDETAPQEQEVNYRVRGVDFFGRRSPAVEVSLFVPTLSHLAAPRQITAQAVEKGNRITWSPGPNPPSTRYIVERSLLPGGPFTVLTPKGITHSETGYLDDTQPTRAGAYYRIRTISSEGQLSPPSDNARVLPLDSSLPPSVQSLEARLGIDSVELSWNAGGDSVAGYIIELKTGSDWQRVNPHIWPDNRFSYLYNTEEKLDLRFRVSAVGRNNQVGPASKELKIEITKVPQGQPKIQAALAGPEGVQITFTFPQNRPDLKFVIRRGESDLDEGLVVSPILQNQERIFLDTRVAPGNRYFYRVQAFTESEWQSDLSPAVPVIIHAGALPVPPQPTAGFEVLPFSHTKITCGQTPPAFRIIVERKTNLAPYWETLKGEAHDGLFTDANPPRTEQISYRLRYLSADGTPGEPSPPVTVTRKN